MADLTVRRNVEGLAREVDPFERMRELMSVDPLRMLERWWGGQPTQAAFIPSFEVKETKDAFVFCADVPGIKEEDLDISITGDRLTVSGKREEEKREEGERFYAYERNYGSFSRSFTLPEGVDAEHIHAEMKNGVLNLTLPKKPEVKPKRILLGHGRKEGKAKA